MLLCMTMLLSNASSAMAGQTLTIPFGDENLVFDLDGGLLTAENRTLVYQVPWQIQAVDASAGEVLDYEGKLIAQYLISEGGLVTVTFSDDYAQRSAAGDPLAVAVEFTTSVANLAWDQAG